MKPDCLKAKKQKEEGKNAFYTSPKPVYVPSPVKGLGNSEPGFSDFSVRQGATSLAFNGVSANKLSKDQIEQLKKIG